MSADAGGPAHGFTPVIVGTDLNAYHMASAFHEGYGITPHVIGKMNLGFTRYSRIIGPVTLVENLDDAEVFLPALVEFAQQHRALGPLLLVGTNDQYVRLIIEHADVLGEHYRFNYPNLQLLDELQYKELFYPLADNHGLPTPETHIHQAGEPLTAEVSRFPAIVKPSDPVQYNRNKFAGQEKVYRVHSGQELAEVVARIEASGYRAPIIIQDFIPGGDTFVYESDLYLTTEGKAEFVTFAQVALQEHEPTAIGNFTAVVSRFNREVMTQLKDFLEGIGYTGLANVDLKYDQRDGEFKILEVNIRQGRSSSLTTAQGYNLAGYLVEDLIRGHRSKHCAYVDEEVLYTVVPRSILTNHVTDPQVSADISRLYRERKVHRPMITRGDALHLRRRAWVAVRGIRYRKKYAEATWAKDPSEKDPARR